MCGPACRRLCDRHARRLNRRVNRREPCLKSQSIRVRQAAHISHMALKQLRAPESRAGDFESRARACGHRAPLRFEAAGIAASCTGVQCTVCAFGGGAGRLDQLGSADVNWRDITAEMRCDEAAGWASSVPSNAVPRLLKPPRSGRLRPHAQRDGAMRSPADPAWRRCRLPAPNSVLLRMRSACSGP
jgi:hypothetical protein